MAAYSITSSARTSSDCGTMRPSAFAVFTLMTRSNLHCCTSRSAGFAPLRNLSGVNSLESIDVCQLWAIAEQTAGLGEVALQSNGRYPTL